MNKVLFASTAILMLAPALAQAQASSTIEEVVVTARRVSENVQSVPVSITVVDSKMLENANVKRLDDIVKFAPGLTIFAATSNPSSNTLSIRGQASADTLGTVDGSTGIYYDGVYLPRGNGLPYLLANFEEVGQVEVLRGPQGTLFGRNTTGGALNITSKAPGQNFSGYGRVTVGDWSTLNAAVGVNLPFGENSGLRVSYLRQQNNGFGRDANGQKLYFQRSNMVHGRFTGKYLDDRLTLDLSGLYISAVHGSSIVKLVAVPSPPGSSFASAAVEAALESGLGPSVAAGAPLLTKLLGGSPFRTDGMQAKPAPFHGLYLSGTVSYKLNDHLTLKSITGYNDFKASILNDLDGSPYDILTSRGFQTAHQISEEAQVIGKWDRLSFVAGGFVSREHGEDNSVSVALRLANPTNPNVIDGFPTNTSKAVFGQANWEVLPRLTLTGGLRYTEDTRKMVSFNRGGQPAVRGVIIPILGPPTGNITLTNDIGRTAAGTICKVPYYTVASVLARQANPSAALVLQVDDPNFCKATFSDKYNATDYLASVDFKISDDVLVFAKTSRGFRAGGQNVRGDASSNAATFSSFGPETATQYELGFKSTFLAGRARVNASVYQTDYKGIQRSVLVFTPLGTYTTVTNAAKATLKGGEIEGVVKPVEQLTLSGSVGRVTGRYDDFQDGNVDRRPTPWGSPRWTYTVGARFAQPTSFGEVALNANYAWYGSGRTLYGDPVNATPGCATVAPPACPAVTYNAGLVKYFPSLGQLSARLNVHINAWDADVAVFGDNLTNELVREGALQILGYRLEYIGRPRFVGVEFSKKFGGGS